MSSRRIWTLRGIRKSRPVHDRMNESHYSSRPWQTPTLGPVPAECRRSLNRGPFRGSRPAMAYYPTGGVRPEALPPAADRIMPPAGDRINRQTRLSPSGVGQPYVGR
jgi:hypothetical protein